MGMAHVFALCLLSASALRTDDRQLNLTQAPEGPGGPGLDYPHHQGKGRLHTQWQEDKDAPSAQEILLAVGGGTGAGSGTGRVDMDRDILRRMRYQDKLVLALMVTAYFVAIIFTASLAYRQACNDSSAEFYADPRVEHLVIDSRDLDDFVQTFAQPPKNVQLNVQGLLPVPALLANLVDSPIEWQGGYYRHMFSFALDLTPFLVAEEHSQTHGLTEQEVEQLRRFLQENGNDLATVKFKKEVTWEGWEDLATNIKQRIRQRGFEGLIHVSWSHAEILTVYKNRSWANFLHMSVTRVLLGLSVVGYIWYLPYMWLRQKGPELQPSYRVNMSIGEYWQLIGDKISERGFDQ